MPVSRRRFLKLALTTASAAALAACGAKPTPTPTPTPTSAPSVTPPPTAAASSAAVAEAAVAATRVPPTATAVAPTATAASLAARNPKLVWGWLRMLNLSSIPSSGAMYQAHIKDIDVAMPLNGGKLQVDGKWLQETPKLDEAWPRMLPRLARSAGQLYMPAMGNDPEGLAAVLDSVGLQDWAAEQLVTLAQSRFDAPWDGVYLDLEGLEANYQTPMSGFLYRIAKAVKGAGLLLGVSVGGIYQDPIANNSQQQQDMWGLPVVAEVADFVDVRVYDYWSPQPYSIAPYWWVQACIEYALSKGIRPETLSASLANFSRYWVSSSNNQTEDLTYEGAMQIIQQAGVTPQLVEQDQQGLVREKYAQIGGGHIWMHDAETYQFGLDLVDKYKLRGHAVFTPGMGDPKEWQAIGDWRAKRIKA
jgi:hypothetical protein